MFHHPDSDINTIYVTKEEIVLIPQKNDGRWTIFAVNDKEGVEDESLNPFLAISLICNKSEREGVIVHMSKPSIEKEKAWEQHG